MNTDLLDIINRVPLYIPRGARVMKSMRNNGWYLHSLVEVDRYQAWAPTIFCMKRYYATPSQGLRPIYHWVDCRLEVLDLNNNAPVELWKEEETMQEMNKDYEDFFRMLVGKEDSSKFSSLPAELQDFYYTDFMGRYFSNKSGVSTVTAENETLKDISLYNTLFAHRFRHLS